MNNCAVCGSHLRSLDGVCPTCVARSISSFISKPPNAPEDVAEVPGYTLHEVIGRGGMGIVHRATRLADARIVAVKLLPEHLLDDDEVADRFAREAQALGAFDHPHVLRVLDSGITPEGRLYLVTEFAAGGDLAKRLQQGALPVAEALRFYNEVLSAIAEAHRQGIVHRDIKPANVLLDAHGRALVADFSLAKLLRAGAVPQFTMTQSADVFGTPYYIAPEVRRGAGSVDERADIYSLGVLLHELLTGRVPQGNYEPASSQVAVPSAVDALIAMCLSEDPAKRPASVLLLQRALNAAVKPLSWAWAALVVAVIAGFAAMHFLKPQREAIAPLQASKTVPWSNSIGMKFVPIAGTRVLFSVWETRRYDYGLFAESAAGNSSPQELWRRPLSPVTPDHPVTPISMQQAVRFCEWLTEKEHREKRLPAAAKYRLPSNDEWSRAAGLTASTSAEISEHPLYAWGRTWPPPAANFPANFAGQEVRSNGLRHLDRHRFTAPVGSYPANDAGLYDMSGNVAEWCLDKDASPPADSTLRGGSWNDASPESLRLDTRVPSPPALPATGAGFRIVLELGL